MGADDPARAPRARPRRLTSGERYGVLGAAVLVVAGLALTFLGGGGAPTGSSTTTGSAPEATEVVGAAVDTSGGAGAGDDRVFPGGGTLAEYRAEDRESYAWRVNILDHEADLLGQLRALPLAARTVDRNASTYARMVATCHDLRRGEDAQRAAVQRWSTPGAPLKTKTAAHVVAVVSETACPGLAPG